MSNTGLVLYPFGVEGCTPNTIKSVVGGKGAALHEMSALGLPVPPGIVIPTAECRVYLHAHDKPHLRAQQLTQLADQVIEFFQTRVAPVLGHMPLLSVRSGAQVSMPGMMDTLLNVGLMQENAEEWKTRLGLQCRNECATRLNDTYAALVGGDTAATSLSLRGQLMGAIGAVFRSWNSERAREYRKLHGYPDDWGTAVTVQAMVFGNVSEQSCSGVLFTRDPATGENAVTGEFLPRAQGEDVVAGTRTPRQLHLMEQWNGAILDQLLEISEKLELHYRDAQDIEFTVQDGKLYILQTRNAKRTALAAFKVAHDMALERVISKEEAVQRVTAAQYQALMREEIDPAFTTAPTFTGLPASPGIVTGRAVFSDSDLAVYAKDPIILIREETSPDDFPAMVKSAAILTSTGGATSHAAVVARGINKPAITGATSLKIGHDHAKVERDGKVLAKFSRGDTLTLDGATGRVWVGVEVPRVGGTLPVEAQAVVEWAVSQSNATLAYEVPKDLALPTSGRYYLSLANLSKKQEFSALLKKLAERPDLTGFIGFSRPKTKVHPDDEQFLSLLSVSVKPPQVSEALLNPFLKAALVGLLPKKLKKRWVVHVPATASDIHTESFVDAEWDIVRPVRTLKDLLAANGYVQFTDEFRVTMNREQVALADMLGLLSKAGRSIRELGAVVSGEDFVAEALGK